VLNLQQSDVRVVPGRIALFLFFEPVAFEIKTDHPPSLQAEIRACTMDSPLPDNSLVAHIQVATCAMREIAQEIAR